MTFTYDLRFKDELLLNNCTKNHNDYNINHYQFSHKARNVEVVVVMGGEGIHRTQYLGITFIYTKNRKRKGDINGV